ncbi:COG4223 family protein [Pseudaestuariivita sp.]|uniref:COG4223 family protein n=1 Tax=Pseudaestuariivita sp. TaxID=2211669 RepID=UPI0040596DD8
MPAPTPAPQHSSGGFVPALIGGVIAAAIGFGAAYYLYADTDTDLTAQVEAQDARIAELEASLTDVARNAEAAASLDLGPIETRLETLTTGLADLTGSVEGGLADAASQSADSASQAQAAVGAVDTRLTTLDERLTALEKRPIEDNVSRQAIDAYERELALLQEAIANERGAIEDLLAQQKAEVARIAENASQMEEQAAAEAERAAAREALTRVQLSLDNGTPFDTALADLSDVSDASIPDVLGTAATDGVATLSELQEQFPGAARVALGAARDAGESGEDGGMLGYLRAQVGARSVEPIEGASADAVLSRVEAAVRVDDFETALAEIEALPPSSRAELEAWETAARARLDAITAAAALAADLN